MSRRTSHWTAGIPCWVDLTAPDVAAASAFYAKVLGWELLPPSEEFGGYVVARVHEAAVAGIGPLQEGAPVAWTLYLASDDADATSAAVVEHGGTLVLPPGDVGPLGRMCIAADPTGAVFGVWQGGEMIGAELVNEPGGLCWEDLRSTDPDAARAFYSSVFGYGHDALPEAGPDYTLFTNAAEPIPLGGIGGMFGMQGQPSHWLVYFGVADVAAAVATAEAAGASVLAPVFDTPYGRMAGLADPWGAVFWVVETDGSASPDRAG